MSFISSMVGGKSGNSGGAGLNYNADRANLQQAVTPEQAAQAYKNSQDALSQQLDFVKALQAQNGISNQSNVFQQQQQLASLLQDRANGGGPNPALNQLAQTTGQNVANQAALMASQRGVGANPGLIARQAAMQGANTQQQAAGQAATLAAQQQLANTQALQNQQAQMAGLSTQQVGQQAGAVGNYNQFAQNEQNQLLNSINAYNQAQVGMQSNMNNANAGIAGIAAQGQQHLLGNAMGALGSPGNLFGGSGGGGAGASSGGLAGGPMDAGSAAPMAMLAAHGGEVPGPKSFVGKFLTGGVQMKAMGGAIDGELMAAQGKMVPGKATVKGDSLKNDKVPAILSPGEIVIPRSIAQSPDAANKAAKFVAAVLSKNGKSMPRKKK